MGLHSLTSASPPKAIPVVPNEAVVALTPAPENSPAETQSSSDAQPFQPDYGQALIRFLGLFGALAAGMWMNKRINQRRRS